VDALIVNFSLDGISEADFVALCDQLAPTFAAVDGLLSKVWLSDPDSNSFGGVYLFESTAAIERFLGSQLFADVAGHPNFADARATRFGVLEGPTRITRGLVTSDA